jgi:hypothetical protein
MIGLAAVLSTEGNWELAIKVLDRAVEKIQTILVWHFGAR